METTNRDELYRMVDERFRSEYPHAPEHLSRTDPAQREWREVWFAVRDDVLNEEVDRLYWEMYPDAPVRIDPSDPSHKPFQDSWSMLRDMIMTNAPDLEVIESDTFWEFDTSYVRADFTQAFMNGVVLLDVAGQELYRDHTLVGVIDTATEDILREIVLAADFTETSGGVWERSRDLEAERGQFVSVKWSAWWDGGVVRGALEVTPARD